MGSVREDWHPWANSFRREEENAFESGSKLAKLAELASGTKRLRMCPFVDEVLKFRMKVS